MLSPSISGTRADSVRAGAAATVPGWSALRDAAPPAAARRRRPARRRGTAPPALRCCICASACSEYGSFSAFGSLLYVAVLPRPDGAAPVNGKVRVSLPTGAIGGAAASGVGHGGAGRCDRGAGFARRREHAARWPTRITLTFSMLFHAASSR